MYFTREAQRVTVARLQRALLPGGWLVVSPAEASADLFRPLVPVNFPGAIFYRKEWVGGQGTGVRDWGLGVRDQGLGVRDLGLGTDLHPPIPSASVEIPIGPVILPVKKPTECREVLPQPPAPSPQILLERARALADQGNLEEAHHLCEAALKRDRLDPEAHLLLAAIYQERGEIQAALEALRRAIYLAPDSAPAHFLLGSLLLQQGERRRGRRCLETVVGLLSPVPRDEVVPGSDGLTAWRLLETARAYLAISHPPSAVRRTPQGER